MTTPAQTLRHPALELLARYRAVLATAWALRHELAGPRRLADEAAFLPAALSLQETPPHPAPRRLAWVLMALFSAALAQAGHINRRADLMVAMDVVGLVACLVAAGRPREALAALQGQVRSHPSDPKLRVFLFQLLSVLGQWDRAHTQLNVVAELDKLAIPMRETASSSTPSTSATARRRRSASGTSRCPTP